MSAVRRLNHAVLYVRDAGRSAAFYAEAFGFVVVAEAGNGAAVFMRAAETENHHDLGLFSVGAQAPAPSRAAASITSGSRHDPRSRAMRERLVAMGVVGESDHGVSKSLYGHDPDGIEFEVLWTVPRADWGDYEREAVVQRLDLPAALARWG
jgi:catechol-2,3-dioxygenase